MDPHRHQGRSGGIRRGVHAYMHEKRDIKTEVDVVYVTASADGDGKVIGFTTLGDSATPTATASATTQALTPIVSTAARTTARATARTTPTPPSTETPVPTTSSTSLSTSTTESTESQTSTTDSTSVSSSEATSSQTTFSTQISSTQISSTQVSSSDAASSIDSSSTDSASTSTSASLSGFLATSATRAPEATPTNSTVPAASGGIPTGVVVGVIAGAAAILLVLGLFAAFFYRRKAQKRMAAAYGKTEDEKPGRHGIAFNEKADDAPSATFEKAPRVSLRPVTQFLPNLMAGAPAATTTAGAGAATTQYRASNLNTRLSGTSPDTRKVPPPTLSLVTAQPTPAPSFSAAPPAPATPTVVISPSGSVFDDAPSTPVGTAAGVVGAAVGAVGINPVHRVQMDFKPSMGDELELRAGALVRLLHEYDDGWALCIRLDRSQQGVCPRTCLSQRPVKPRPQAPPPPGSPPQGRPQSPVIHPYSPASSPQNRNFPQSPVTAHAQSPTLAHPQSPTMRPMSPGVGYVKAQYRPASPSQIQVESRPGTPTQSAPQSPIAKISPPPSLRVGPPQITISTAPESLPVSPSGSRPQSPVNVGPAFAPAKPSPLSTEQRVSVVNIDTEEKKEAEAEQPTFHAM